MEEHSTVYISHQGIVEKNVDRSSWKFERMVSGPKVE